MAELPAPTTMSGGERGPTAAVQSRAASSPPIVDVWSRTQPKYRVRAVLLLTCNFLLYCGLCVFTHWLHVARVDDFSVESYLNPLRFWVRDSQNLNDFVHYPINVEQTPIHGAVLGLLLASMVAVPILIAILYRWYCALPFIVAVFVLGHLPWMAITLCGSCILASVRPFRMNFRFGSALVGMLPVLAYLYQSTRGGAADIGASSPVGTSIVTATWVLAILAACAMLAVVLAIARAVNYRPEAVTPVVAVMFATPVLLFHTRVGTDEVAYRVLEAEYGPHAQRFEPAEPEARTQERVLGLVHAWTDDADDVDVRRPEIRALFAGQIEPFRRRVAQRLMLDFLAERAEAYEACKRFMAAYPESRYDANVLYIQARIMDTRLDERRLPARRELYTDFPHVQSEEPWRQLATRYPDSPLAIAAGLRLAELHLRRGQVDESLKLLADVLAHPAGGVADTQPSQLSLLRAVPAESTLGFEPQWHLDEARRLHDRVVANRDDAKYGAAPLAALAALDPRRNGYEQQLCLLTSQYRDSLLYDNLVVLWAACLPDVATRAAALERCAAEFETGDARPEALFRLAELEIQVLALSDSGRRTTGIARLKELVESYGSACWGQFAAERLSRLTPAADGTQAAVQH